MTLAKEPSPTALVVPMDLRGSRISAAELLAVLHRNFVVKGPDSFGRFSTLSKGRRRLKTLG